MLNIGLIGNIANIEKQVEKLKKYPDIRIQGKSSVGTKTQNSEYSFTIPEYNRIELIERSDAIILEDSTLVPYTLIKDSIKRSKHIFFSEYPDFTEEQCSELIKLIDEAGTIVQIRNPLFFNSQVQLMVKNTSAPFYLNVEIQKPISEINNKIIWDVILLIIKMGQSLPKKVKTITSEHKENLFYFQNIRIEYSDSSVLELNMLFSGDTEKYNIKSVSDMNYFNLNLVSNQINSVTGQVITKNTDVIKEYESFFKSVIKRQASLNGIREYLVALDTVSQIKGKINIASL
ncbi:MAG: hypothetical protein JXR31_10800 [Prolixibacteraceae bacterium]|nr:hypothetical protein [Prolixibacteraceae bacterium]MBN2774729.1 hypothetical protein [Prolixibacteraceae bacterium]